MTTRDLLHHVLAHVTSLTAGNLILYTRQHSPHETAQAPATAAASARDSTHHTRPHRPRRLLLPVPETHEKALTTRDHTGSGDCCCQCPRQHSPHDTTHEPATAAASARDPRDSTHHTRPHRPRRLLLPVPETSVERPVLNCTAVTADTPAALTALRSVRGTETVIIHNPVIRLFNLWPSAAL